MAKFPTFPTTCESLLQINISNLKKWNYLKPDIIKNGSLSWSRNGKEIASISILANTCSKTHYIELNYKFNDKPINYKVNIEYFPSNLGVGEIPFFICPITLKKCRKLYQINGYFLNRTAIKNCMYEKQIQSKKYRFIEKKYGDYFSSERLYEQLYKKHFKTHYKSKPTKKYKKIMNKLNRVESIPYSEIEALYIRK